MWTDANFYKSQVQYQPASHPKTNPTSVPVQYQPAFSTSHPECNPPPVSVQYQPVSHPESNPTPVPVQYQPAFSTSHPKTNPTPVPVQYQPASHPEFDSTPVLVQYQPADSTSHPETNPPPLLVQYQPASHPESNTCPVSVSACRQHIPPWDLPNTYPDPVPTELPTRLNLYTYLLPLWKVLFQIFTVKVSWYYLSFLILIVEHFFYIMLSFWTVGTVKSTLNYSYLNPFFLVFDSLNHKQCCSQRGEQKVIFWKIRKLLRFFGFTDVQTRAHAPGPFFLVRCWNSSGWRRTTPCRTEQVIQLPHTESGLLAAAPCLQWSCPCPRPSSYILQWISMYPLLKDELFHVKWII